MRNKDIDIGGLIYTIYDNGEVYRGNRKIKQRPCYNDGYASFTAGKKNSRKSARKSGFFSLNLNMILQLSSRYLLRLVIILPKLPAICYGIPEYHY